jgi:hypothetical protein
MSGTSLEAALGLVGTGIAAAAPGLRAPRPAALLDGAALPGLVRLFVSVNNHYAANHFACEFAYDASLAAEAAFWAETGSVLLTLAASFAGPIAGVNATTAATLLTGIVDSVALDPVAGRVVIRGRDLTAPFIETRITQSYANQTASEIATQLAENHGLTPNVTPTTTPVGRYYADEHDRITLDQFSRATTEWNLLVWLAEREGFDVWVDGSTLNFAPRPTALIPALTLAPAPTAGAITAERLWLERALTLAGDVSVTVKSWNSRTQAAYSETVTATGVSSLGALGGSQSYVFVKPNLSPNAALAYATQKLAEITRHERVLEAEIPGELDLGARDVIALTGTNTAFDQLYYVDVIEREIGLGGFREWIRAKNASPGRMTTPPADVVLSTTGP